jgi:hypothetical protein
MIKVKKSSYLEVAIILQKRIPKLRNVSIYEISENLKGTGLSFLKQNEEKPSLLIRLSLPFGIVFYFLLVICIPFVYLIHGRWYYDKLWISNYFKKLIP